MANKRIFYEYEPGDEVWVISPNISTCKLHVVRGDVEEVVHRISEFGVGVSYSVIVQDSMLLSGRASIFYMEPGEGEVFDTCEGALEAAVRLVDERQEYRRFTIAVIYS